MAKSSRYHPEQKTGSLSDLISDAYDEISCLADEMGEWRDNVEEKFSTTAKFEQISECADTLDSYRDPPDVDDDLVKDLEVTYSVMVKRKSRRGPSRQVRFDNAINQLSACVDALQSKIDDLEESQENIQQEAATAALGAELTDGDDLAEHAAGLEELRDALQETIDELEGAVEFPGMFG